MYTSPEADSVAQQRARSIREIFALNLRWNSKAVTLNDESKPQAFDLVEEVSVLHYLKKDVKNARWCKIPFWLQARKRCCHQLALIPLKTLSDSYWVLHTYRAVNMQCPRIRTRIWWTQWAAWVGWVAWAWAWVVSCLALAWAAWEWWWMEPLATQLWQSRLRDQLRRWENILETLFLSHFFDLLRTFSWPLCKIIPLAMLVSFDFCVIHSIL